MNLDDTLEENNINIGDIIYANGQIIGVALSKPNYDGNIILLINSGAEVIFPISSFSNICVNYTP